MQTQAASLRMWCLVCFVFLSLYFCRLYTDIKANPHCLGPLQLPSTLKVADVSSVASSMVKSSGLMVFTVLSMFFTATEEVAKEIAMCGSGQKERMEKV